jgi:16S rRNA (cytosine967-C5)-methyltransferase
MFLMTFEGYDKVSFPPRAGERVVDVALDLAEHVRSAVARRKPADVAAARYFARHRELGARDRRFLADVVFSYFRWRGWFLGDAGEDVPLACAAGYALDAQELPEVVHRLAERAATRLAQPLCPMGGWSLEERQKWAEQALGRACPLERVVPDWVPGCLYAPPDVADHVARVMKAFQTRPPVWLYALRGARAEVQSALRAAGVECAGHEVMPGALRLSEQAALRGLPRELRARFMVQDLASQCVARACAPKPGERWFDACAGAGGQTLHLADLMEERGQVCATDVRSDMLRELYRRLCEAGFACIKIGAGAGQADFDGVLVDAPCSGMGTWARNPDARWRARPADVAWAERRQKSILTTAARRVKSGGVLVYSVCTLTRSETLGVTEAFLTAHRDFELEPFAHPLRPSEQAAGWTWVWPWDGPCGAMFIARFRRCG